MWYVEKQRSRTTHSKVNPNMVKPHSSGHSAISYCVNRITSILNLYIHHLCLFSFTARLYQRGASGPEAPTHGKIIRIIQSDCPEISLRSRSRTLNIRVSVLAAEAAGRLTDGLEVLSGWVHSERTVPPACSMGQCSVCRLSHAQIQKFFMCKAWQSSQCTYTSAFIKNK